MLRRKRRAETPPSSTCRSKKLTTCTPDSLRSLCNEHGPHMETMDTSFVPPHQLLPTTYPRHHYCTFPYEQGLMYNHAFSPYSQARLPYGFPPRNEQIRYMPKHFTTCFPQDERSPCPRLCFRSLTFEDATIDSCSVKTIDVFDQCEDNVLADGECDLLSQYDSKLPPPREIVTKSSKTETHQYADDTASTRTIPVGDIDTDRTQFLGHDFIPGDWDVICGRGKSSYNHVGNRRLRLLIATKIERYTKSNKRRVKTSILDEIVQQVKEASRNGGFVRKVPSEQDGIHHWYSVGVSAARARVGHSIRDCLPESLRTRTKAPVVLSQRIESVKAVEQALVLSSISDFYSNQGTL